MKRSFFTSTLFAAIVGMLIAALLPCVVKNNFILGLLAFVAINTIIAVGLNLVMGYAGQVSLGHAAFFGIGAYTTAIMTTQHPANHLLVILCNPWIAILAGVVITCTVALLLGIPCLRLSGHYLAMATLGFGWIIYTVIKQWDQLTQGTSGIRDIPSLSLGPLVFRHHHLGPLVFDHDISRFYLTWACAIALLVLSANVVNSRLGRALRAVHGSEAAAASLGINVAWYKIRIFVLSSAYASIAGSLYAHTVNYICPSNFSFSFSVELVVMVVIGGMASVWGAPVGAATITLLTNWLSGLGQNIPALKDCEVIVNGLILILVMVFMPTGVVCGLRDIFRRAVRKSLKATAPQAAGQSVHL